MMDAIAPLVPSQSEREFVRLMSDVPDIASSFGIPRTIFHGHERSGTYQSAVVSLAVWILAVERGFYQGDNQ